MPEQPYLSGVLVQYMLVSLTQHKVQELVGISCYGDDACALLTCVMTLCVKMTPLKV